MALFAAKFFLLGPATQVPKEELNIHLANVLASASSGPVKESRQSKRSDLHQFQFNLSDCDQPYWALQALVLEDLQAVIDAAGPFPADVLPHVFHLGQELAFDDRFGLKTVAIKKFISFRLGRSRERPTAYLYIILASPNCTGYRGLEWSRVWAATCHCSPGVIFVVR